MDFSYRFPASINFGKGIFHNLFGVLADKPEIKRVLIICGKHIEAKVEKLILSMQKAGQCILVSDITPEPDIAEVDRCVSAMPDAQAVFAIGGGSVMDVGKATAMMLTNEGKCADYFYQRRSFVRRGVFFVAVPTSAGTGSESTPNAVLADHAKSIKQSIRHDWMLPSVAWADPELTYDMPQAISAATGMDALTQGIESYCSRRASSGTRALAADGVKNLLEFLAAACRNDYPARDKVAEASMLIGMAFGQSGLGAVHGIGHPIGCLLKVPHGVTCAVLLVELLKRNHHLDPAPLDNLAQKIGFGNGEILIGQIARLRKELNLPENFSSYKLAPAHYQFVVKNCRSGSMKCNPREYTDAEIEEILEALS